MTTDTVGGVWSYTLALCKGLLPFNVHFYLITTGAPMQPIQKQEIAGLENVTVYETDFMLEWMESPWESIDASGEWLLQLENQLKPDLVHLNAFAYGSLSWQAPVLVVAHSDVWSWWLAVKQEHPPDHWGTYYRRVQAGLNKAGFIVAPSATMMKYIRSIYAVNTPGKAIFNGRDAQVFRPGKKAPVVFSMGRIWDEAKNTSLVVEAAPNIPYPIRLAGENSFHSNNYISEGTNISYLGKLSQQEIALELSVTSVYVHPARYEPFGLSVLEAALSGCALVLGNIDSLSEIWSDNALYVDTNDAGELAARVNYLMDNDDERIRLGEKARLHATGYSTLLMAESYLGVYRHLLHKLND